MYFTGIVKAQYHCILVFNCMVEINVINVIKFYLSYNLMWLENDIFYINQIISISPVITLMYVILDTC